MNSTAMTRVWDLPVRLFHWSLVASFILAYLSGDELLGLHTFAGYTIIGLVLFRLVWGVVGSRYARFSQFVKRPATVVAYLKEIASFRARRYLGHNPAGGAMVVALLISLLVTTLSGLAVYGAEEMAGPLAETMQGLPHFAGEAVEELHEFFANFTVLLVLLHVAGVLIASLQHNENLIRSMIHGLKPADDQEETTERKPS